MEKIKLDELQLKIMKVIWEKREASVSQIQTALMPDREFAITTISTVLQRLYKKGIVDFHKEGRQYIYTPLITEKETQSSMTNNLVSQLFGGKSSVLVNHLLQENAFEKEELEELKKMIEAAQKKKKSRE
ncbi:MAG: BlaI/MecI/CopY family transcriptional regulator [Bacteroidota bacterium]